MHKYNTFKPKKNGCRERQDYGFLKFYKRGAAHNCLIVKHFDVQRELYGSDYDEDRVFSALIRTWARKNNIKLPENFWKIVNYHWENFPTQEVKSPKTMGLKKWINLCKKQTKY